ncbi:Uncharacterised protein [Delftia tsuruhatensis]|uniref:hypothetical protein n=1 Tax=Delftia tsuruhatensis TaxID=180282 RepID=UPI001E72D5C7|nr:hypothetical protein [Delftia tsuruhatensis]CAB5699899.1 Uncharacterised protein [Delftia tsuruhatensis]CAC9693606.1 Uncharacterised protein [Delftia tsuruhatensis]
MTSIPSTGAGFAASALGTRPQATVAVRQPQAGTQGAAASGAQDVQGTQVTLGQSVDASAIYARPQPVDMGQFRLSRTWASQDRGDVSTLMARNLALGPSASLADRWRGLGGALLSRIAAGQTDFRQAIAEYQEPTQTDAVAGGADPQALDKVALGGVSEGAATVSLKIRTQSGQSVELRIATNDGSQEGSSSGLRVEVTSSGTLSQAESAAIGRLADGLDEALEALGQRGKPRLELGKLMDFDRGVLAGLDLDIQNPKPSQPLSSFSLHVGADGKSVAMKGAAGELAVNLESEAPVGVSASQRQAALDQHLQRFDAAAQRGRADEALVDLFKSAFTQLHSAQAPEAAQRMAVLSGLERSVQSLQSGLADFQASFSGDFEKTNRFGAVTEAGRAEYQVGQKTSRQARGTAGETIAQVMTESLDAYSKKARHSGMLDPLSGNYDLIKVKDSSSITTLIETGMNQIASARRDTQESRLHTWEQLEKHRVQQRRETPEGRSFTELIGVR